MQSKTSLNPITLVLILLVVLLTGLPFRKDANSQTAEPTIQTTTVNRAPSGLYLNYQGQVLDNNGQPIDATLPMTFELFQMLTGGTACQGWSEAHSVAVTDGVFSITLGQSTAIPDECLIDDIYLQLTIDGEILTPREQLTPFANTLPSESETSGLLKVARYGNEGGEIQLAEGTTGNAWTLDNYYGNFRLHHDGSSFLELDPNGNLEVGHNLTLDGTLYVDTPGTAGAGEVIVGSPGNTPGIALLSNSNPEYRTDIRRTASGLDFAVHQSGGIPPVRLSIGNGGTTRVHGQLIVGSCSLSQSNNDGELACTSGSITTGAFIEANLQTQEEMRAERIERFEQGDLLCWATETEQLALCDSANDRLVMAVADQNGKPIVMGAEPIKVIGKVEAGDILVASDTPGYAIVNNNPTPGTVIGQALEDSDGDRGIIKAMIRKW